jgi:uncharacterized protein YjcR
MAYIIETLREIAQVVGRKPNTVRKWIDIHGFPASKAPNGKWITTHGLIDSWIVARAKQNPKATSARAGKAKGNGKAAPAHMSAPPAPVQQEKATSMRA